MILKLYKHISYLLIPIAYVILRRRLHKGKEDSLRWKERLGFPSTRREEAPYAWLHAASVGESLSLLSVIKIFKNKYPNYKIIVTTGTKTSAEMMHKRLPDDVLHQYIPLDIPLWINRFLDYWSPKKLIIVESELWPGLISCCKNRHIPIYLLNAKLSNKSYKKWKSFSCISSPLFKSLSLVLAQSKENAQRYQSLGSENVDIMPHLKYAADPLPFNQQGFNLLSTSLQDRLFYTAISTHPGEEEHLINAHLTLKAKHPNFLTIIIPRHTNRQFDFNKVKALKRSESLTPNADTDIYIIDTMGEVGLFAHLSNICIIGGTFVNIGGHNPLEAMMLGAQVLVGPYHYNLLSIIDDFPEIKVTSPSSISKDLENILHYQNNNKTIKNFQVLKQK